MTNPDTSAQDAPVASQEAEARAQIIDDAIAGTLLVDALPFQLDAYAAAIRASEREGREALVEGVRALHNGHGGAYGGVFCYSACHALAALEEAGSE